MYLRVYVAACRQCNARLFPPPSNQINFISFQFLLHTGAINAKFTNFPDNSSVLNNRFSLKSTLPLPIRGFAGKLLSGYWSMAAMLRDSVVHTRPRAIPPAIITMKKSMYGFPLTVFRAAGAPL